MVVVIDIDLLEEMINKKQKQKNIENEFLISKKKKKFHFHKLIEYWLVVVVMAICNESFFFK